MTAYPEKDLQVMINKFVRNHVPPPHFFCGIDRSKATGKFTHVRDKARGLIAGTPDTLLIYPGLPPITVELKAPGNRPTERQEEVGRAIQAAGGGWGWCSSVRGYAALLQTFGVPLAGMWGIAADGHDATLAGAAIKREERKTGKPSAKRYGAPKPSPTQLRRFAAVRGRAAKAGILI